MGSIYIMWHTEIYRDISTEIFVSFSFCLSLLPLKRGVINFGRIFFIVKLCIHSLLFGTDAILEVSYICFEVGAYHFCYCYSLRCVSFPFLSFPFLSFPHFFFILSHFTLNMRKKYMWPMRIPTSSMTPPPAKFLYRYYPCSGSGSVSQGYGSGFGFGFSGLLPYNTEEKNFIFN